MPNKNQITMTKYLQSELRFRTLGIVCNLMLEHCDLSFLSNEF